MTLKQNEQEELSRHERYDELCALALSGGLTPDESIELNAHLEVCADCREAYEDYAVVHREGMPILASRFGETREPGSWNHAAVERELFTRFENPRRQVQALTSSFRQSAVRNLQSLWRYVQLAAAACLVIASGYGIFELGKRTRPPATQEARNIAPVVAEERYEKLAAEKKSVDELLVVQSQKLTQLQADGRRKQEEVENLRSSLEAIEDRSNDLAAAKATSDDQLRAISQERGTLAIELEEAKQGYARVETELTRLLADRDKTMLHMASLETQVAELSATKRNAEQYLASDRDVRELMGARQLYIADVFDVSSDSRTRKPYGRVFLTKGKSLIFYAFDLQQQSKLKNASAFQAWGKNEADQTKVLSLGILYMDSETNHRWALRCDDPKQLAEIDAIFVTVEPQGGSNRPTGKPFLYASLRKEANHP
jgi:anti-sigma-K factor RskA